MTRHTLAPLHSPRWQVCADGKHQSNRRRLPSPPCHKTQPPMPEDHSHRTTRRSMARAALRPTPPDQKGQTGACGCSTARRETSSTSAASGAGTPSRVTVSKKSLSAIYRERNRERDRERQGEREIPFGRPRFGARAQEVDRLCTLQPTSGALHGHIGLSTCFGTGVASLSYVHHHP